MSENNNDVTITVDASRATGPLKRIWRSIGYDEINWTYTPTGKRIFGEIAAMGDGPYWIRNHNIFSSGNLRGSPFMGSTNCYTEDADGRPRYDWSVVDRVYDTFLAHGCKPMTELDFIPHALSTHPEKGPWISGLYEPRDYDKWRELNFRFAEHLIDRYGKDEVRTWYFSSWNEPGLSRFIEPEPGESQEHVLERKIEAFLRIHDYAGDGVLAADRELRFGGPDHAGERVFLDRFLKHCHDETNYATGELGSRLDFISLHGKGTGPENGRVLGPDYDNMARRAVLQYAAIIRKYERFRDLPLLLNEWDIDKGTDKGLGDFPDLCYRNDSYFPTWLIRVMKGLLDLRQEHGLNIELATQWTFYFEGMRCFEGTRSLLDPMGIRKPVFNGFAMLARMGDTRVAATTDDTLTDVAPGEWISRRGARRPLNAEMAASMAEENIVMPHPRIDALASRRGDQIQMLVWNQTCDQHTRGSRNVTLRINGLEAFSAVHVEHYRIDRDHSNAHTAWQAAGCPDWPTPAQVAEFRKHERLERLIPDSFEPVADGSVTLRFELPLHGVSQVILDGRNIH